MEKNLDELIETTLCNASLVANLLKNGILSKTDKQTIKTSNGDFERSDKLYEILITRVNAYNILLESLIETKQSGAAKILSDGLEEYNRSLKVPRVIRRHTKISKPKLSEGNYNTIIRDLNGEPFSKVFLDDLKILPKHWTLRYMNIFLACDTNLKTILCDEKFPLYVNTHHGSIFPIPIQIFVKNLAGKIMAFQVLDNVSIADFKYLVFQNLDVSVDQQKLMWSGKLLEDEKTLRDYKILNESTLQLVLRLKGGLQSIDLETNQIGGVALPAIYEWEGYKEGINPIGECLNESCPTQECNKGETIYRAGYSQLRLNRSSSKFPCAACGDHFTPTNFIVSCGRALFRFKKLNCSETKSVVLESLEEYENYTIFDPAGNTVEYDMIEIHTVKKDWTLNFCIFCEETIRINDEYNFECQHKAHKICAENKGCCICEAEFISSEEFQALLLEQKLTVTDRKEPSHCAANFKQTNNREVERVIRKSSNTADIADNNRHLLGENLYNLALLTVFLAAFLMIVFSNV
ncbi:Ubiquitin-60S ribosomal protein L40 [Orchesella cincta]|uniref:Ubiquitin-60S ribosomal protein L40 n=1 Tax=Orchesella cincta TaxID=48709 RepID=A0A1D2MCX1_ORCCI|nr:Ubiquitin-60S ribosomal protein L40 [Orchesella cincta]